MNDKTTVLVVDDNEDLVDTFAMILKRRGYDVQTACDGFGAVDKFKDHSFDITLMDVVMPDMNGVDAFRKIKEIQPDASIILMTAYSDDNLIKSAVDEGVTCIMQKPIRIDSLIKLIDGAAGNEPIVVVDDNTIFSTLQNKVMVTR